jgi:uncharacterized protein (DUF1697 family)
MATYISILRGINVGGKNRIQMDGLKALYENLKFTNVLTYIQSGNIIFETDSNPATKYFSKLIEEAIYEHYKFNVSVIIRSLEEMTNVIKANPFIAEHSINIEKLHVTFLSEKPESTLVSNVKSLMFLLDRFKIVEKEIYLYCPNGYGTTKLNNNFFESKLKVTATTRNWNTVNKLVELAGSQN